MDRLDIYIKALCVIGMLSFMWKENPYYQLMEHIFVGLAAGQAVAAGYALIKNSALTPIAKGSWALLLPIIVGLMLYLRFFKQVAWLARIPNSLLLGIGLGAGTAGCIASDVVAQTRATMVPITNLTNAVFVIGWLTIVSFFFFTLFQDEKRGFSAVRVGVKHLSTVGRWTLMICFGASVGNVISGRLSMLINKLQFILGDLLGIIHI